MFHTPLYSMIPHTYTHKFVQVILDLGHVTFGNVSDWSAEEKDLGIEAQLPDIDEDDDGKCLGLLWALPTLTPSSSLTHSHPPHPSPTHISSSPPPTHIPSSSRTHSHPPHPSPTHTLLIPHPLIPSSSLTHSYPPHPSPTHALLIPHLLAPSSSRTHSYPPHPSPTHTLLIPHPLTHAFTQPLTLIPLTYFHPTHPHPPPRTATPSPHPSRCTATPSPHTQPTHSLR